MEATQRKIPILPKAIRVKTIGMETIGMEIRP
jgi:hypothetical protein